MTQDSPAENIDTLNDAPEHSSADSGDISIAIQAARITNYAAVQNKVSLIHQVSIENKGLLELLDLQLLIGANPGFIEGIRIPIAKLSAGQTYTFSQTQLKNLGPNHEYFYDLNEAEKGQIVVKCIVGERVAKTQYHDIEILARDEWGAIRGLPELLAAHVEPNAPEIDQLLSAASIILKTNGADLALDGYQSKNRERVWKQVNAIYKLLCSKQLQYAPPPASFESSGQKIRNSAQILDGKLSTCLDSAILLASCFEQAGLNPVILTNKGHAWVGVWLVDAHFPLAVVDSAQDVRKRVDAGELLLLEATDLTSGHAPLMTRSKAVADGYLEESTTTFQYAVDIKRARQSHIKPMKTLIKLAKNNDASDGANNAHTSDGLNDDTLESMPHLPAVDPASLNPTNIDLPATPEGRITRWKSKLLDLTLRNKLLNFKPGKRFLPLITHSPALLEDALSATEREFKLTAKPALLHDNDPRSEALFRQEHGMSSAQAHAKNALSSSELVFDCPSTEFANLSVAIYREGKTALEETGSNSLYLSLGMLHWKETPESETVLKAPILLLPVTLKRPGVGAGIRLQRLDEDILFNPTLLQKLAIQFEINLPYTDGKLPADENGVDVDLILQTLRKRVAELAGFEVRQDCYLGNFSFTKYVMWKDLESNAEALQKSPVVSHLVNNNGEAFIEQAKTVQPNEIDNLFSPQQLLTPLLSDSSQLAVICTADRGKNMVVQGPPGTGKSQTITNMIAHFLAQGKTVLFVAEKMAALEVVHKRLKDIGLDEFCLELHSSKAKKSEIAQQISLSLNSAKSHSPAEWEMEAQRLASLRNQLNSLVTVLHTVHKNGLSVFSAMGRTLAHKGAEASKFSWPVADTHDVKQLATLGEFVGELSALGGRLSSVFAHPLSEIGVCSWSPSWESALLEQAGKCLKSIDKLEHAAAELGTFTNIDASAVSAAQLKALDGLCSLIMTAAAVPQSAMDKAFSSEARNHLKRLIDKGNERNQHRSTIPDYMDEVSGLNSSALRVQWNGAIQQWWPKSWFAKRSVTSQIKLFSTSGKRLSDEQLPGFLNTIAALSDCDRYLHEHASEGRDILGESYDGHKTDWTVAQSHLEWMDEFNRTSTTAFEALADKAQSAKAELKNRLKDSSASLEPSSPIFAAARHFRDAFSTYYADTEALKTMCQPRTEFLGGTDTPSFLIALKRLCHDISAYKLEIQPWCVWNSGRDKAVAEGLRGLVDQVQSGEVELKELIPHFKFSYSDWWLRKIMDTEPLLANFSGAAQDFKVDEFRKADERFQELTIAYTQAVLKGRIPAEQELTGQLGNEVAFLRREAQKQRMHKPIREVIKTSASVIRKLKPCMLMSPQSVAQYLEAGSQLFDIVVFDEASQIPTWDAVGAIARGKQLVCVGDPKQLPPTNFFNSSDSEGVFDEDAIQEMESILDECLGAGLPTLQLSWHYRSKNEGLISFSNYQYYDNSLVTFPSPVVVDNSVEFVDSKGIYEPGKSRTNKIEAQLIVDEIAKHYKSGNANRLSLGVITFNSTQQTLIEKLLDERRLKDKALDSAIAQNTNEDLFIKNLENVQGDERDIIFFSITFGKDANGKLSMNFGPMNKEGGHRRLNVAATRARHKVKIFSSMRPQDIDLSKTNARGVADLKAYLDFAINGAKALTSQAIPVAGGEPESPFELAVIQTLRDHGWQVTPQVGVSGYRIDMAVHSKNETGKFILGVECDGATYHSAPSARDRDRLRQIILEGLGWKIHRIWSTDWWFNPQIQLKKLLEKLESIEQDKKSD